VVVQNLTRQREDRTKRIQLTIEHAEKQLSEFYSPLLALAMRLDQTAKESKRIEKAPNTARPDIDKIMWEDVYLPIHNEIINILKTKIHLIEGYNIETAKGFKKYLRHYASQEIYWRLLAKGHTIPGDTYPYPELFNADIKKGLSTVSKRYRDGFQELRGNRSAASGVMPAAGTHSNVSTHSERSTD
jgi:hypothetical protein